MVEFNCKSSGIATEAMYTFHHGTECQPLSLKGLAEMFPASTVLEDRCLDQVVVKLIHCRTRVWLMMLYHLLHSLADWYISSGLRQNAKLTESINTHTVASIVYYYHHHHHVSLDFVFLEQNALPHDGIKLDQCYFVLCIGDIFPCSIKETRSRRAQQFDSDGLAPASGQCGKCRMHNDAVVEWMLFSLSFVRSAAASADTETK
jgi:hypothetical protein